MLAHSSNGSSSSLGLSNKAQHRVDVFSDTLHSDQILHNASLDQHTRAVQKQPGNEAAAKQSGIINHADKRTITLVFIYLAPK